MRKFTVTAASAGTRADVFVAKKFPDFTRASLVRLFNENSVLINGKAPKSGQKLKVKDQVKVDDKLLKTQPGQIDLPILYEDSNVIVINKPAGLLTHSKGALNSEPTVASFIKPKIDSQLNGNRAGIIHRLDRDTSGLIITAKTEAAAAILQKQFSLRKVKKTYLAVAEGQPDPSHALINAPIERNPKQPQTFRVGSGGKPAETEYKVLKVFVKNGKEYSLLELKPKTGRTHQLRVHLNYIGHPILGDRVYGKAGDNLYLFAKSLELTLPGGKRRVFEAPLPDFFVNFSK